MPDTPDPLPPDLRFLKGLVLALTATMIGAAVAVVALLWTRLPAPVRAPEGLAIPAGTPVEAVTRGRGWWIVTTADGRVMTFDADGAMLREIDLN
ncbi:hypothetical protein JQC91_00555 [Jannaschia sp. Os4]|uniref:DUF6476 family protein n=1 Tax=Jannaschia sp. Os4 TaxID=2807617 RepID=UPI00193A3B77|nr:DUF6476 family protein [Jannaschia sp. Os4]MBM2574781.1 hypothetical protein [Jannaschia sp. Os4]